MMPVDSERHGMYVGLDTRCYFTYQTGATLEKNCSCHIVCVCVLIVLEVLKSAVQEN